MKKIATAQIQIHEIEKNDENLLAAFFESVVSYGLNNFFHPHPFTAEMAHKIANYTGDDWYAGVFIKSSHEKSMAGYVMLRGWDEGYEIPSFGVCVLPGYQKRGLGYLLLYMAISMAGLRGSPAIRLKVYPGNTPAIDFYKKMGFQFQENLEKDQMVGYLRLDH